MIRCVANILEASPTTQNLLVPELIRRNLTTRRRDREQATWPGSGGGEWKQRACSIRPPQTWPPLFLLLLSLFAATDSLLSGQRLTRNSWCVPSAVR